MIFSVSPKSSLSWSEEKGQIFEAKLSRKRSSINYLKKNRDHRKSLMLLESAGFFHGQRINCWKICLTLNCRGFWLQKSHALFIKLFLCILYRFVKSFFALNLRWLCSIRKEIAKRRQKFALIFLFLLFLELLLVLRIFQLAFPFFCSLIQLESRPIYVERDLTHQFCDLHIISALFD